MKVTILGCGSSGGVPLCCGVPGGDWGACNPNNPKNRRMRACILVQSQQQNILVDTGPDLRHQIMATDVDRIDAVLYTHDHADHTHGLDELRYFAYRSGGPIEAYMDKATQATVTKRFGYAFTSTADPQNGYPALLDDKIINKKFSIGKVEVVPFTQSHGVTNSVGYCFGDLAYSTDVVSLDERAFEKLTGVKYWIVDCLRYDPHPSHAHLDLALEWIERLKPQRTILTHMNQQLDYEEILAKCPKGVEPAYDGMVLEL